MNLDSIEDLKQYGFTGFQTMKDLIPNGGSIPKEKGVYLVLRDEAAKEPEFLPRGTGGHFENRDPNVTLERLRSNWVKDRLIVYIGKAGGADKKATLRSRIKQLFGFGQGQPTAHAGGRYIWQIKDATDLLLCWKPLPNEEPSDVESDLIRQFSEKFAQRPFANLKD
jgi:hypothetical protein